MTPKFQDYYTTLGVSREATPEEIKKAFRKLARQYHPDTAKDKKTAEEKFKEINEAHEVLSDPEKRRRYDRLGARWNEQEGGSAPSSEWGGFSTQDAGGGYAYDFSSSGSPDSEHDFHFGGTGFSDFFEQFFGRGSRRAYSSANAEDGDVDMDDEPAVRTRKRRRGTSRARKGQDIEGDILVTLEEAMHGTVRPISLQTVNRQTGKVETHEFQVRIPPGATDGRRIRVPAQGEAGRNGGAAGDLYLRVRLAAHPDFTAREADILHELDVAPWEAVLGAEVIVPTLDSSIKLRIPAGTEDGQQLRVRGRGLPKAGQPGARGDFYVTVNVVLPSKVSDAERRLWEQLRSVSKFQPRG